MQGILRIGLTGGIGSGKSTVARLLAAHGAAVLDADAISRQTTAAGGSAIDAIRTVFGPDFIGRDGALDRARMRQHVFTHPAARQQLEAIIHPLVAAETTRQVNAAIAAGQRCLVFDTPLLVESRHRRSQMDQVLVVDCTPETQIQRTMQRDGLAREAIERILAAQVSRAQRLHAADIVLCNESLSLPELAAEVALIAHGFGL